MNLTPGRGSTAAATAGCAATVGSPRSAPGRAGRRCRPRGPAAAPGPPCPGRRRGSPRPSRNPRARTRTCGCVTSVPSTREYRPSMPITPPQVRVPTTGRAERLDRRVDDVAVRAGELVGDRHHRPARRVARVGVRARTRAAGPSRRSGEPASRDELRGVAAAVLADVHDEALARAPRPAGRGGSAPSPAPHVGDVQIAEPAAGLLVDVRRRPATQSW